MKRSDRYQACIEPDLAGASRGPTVLARGSQMYLEERKIRRSRGESESARERESEREEREERKRRERERERKKEREGGREERDRTGENA
jgi:hypothetical protein